MQNYPHLTCISLLSQLNVRKVVKVTHFSYSSSGFMLLASSLEQLCHSDQGAETFYGFLTEAAEVQKVYLLTESMFVTMATDEVHGN